MSNWSDLKAAVAEVVKTNGNQEITGQTLQNILNSIISNLGKDRTFAGIATTTTNPGTPDGNIFYIAGEGQYVNFSNILIEKGQLGFLFNNNGTWGKSVLEINSESGNIILDWNTDEATTRKTLPRKYRKPGLKISYNIPGKGWKNEQYVGTATDDYSWGDDRKWISINLYNGFRILDWNTDEATTRKQIPQKERKVGMLIYYKHPEYGSIYSQYIGSSLGDKEWGNSLYWQNILYLNFANGFNDFTSLLNYGIYKSKISKIRISISDDGDGNYSVNFSRNKADNDDLKIRMRDKIVNMGHTFSYKCENNFTKNDTVYIYVQTDKRFQITLYPNLPSLSSSNTQNGFICILFWDAILRKWCIIDKNNIFCYDNNIVNCYYLNKRFDISMFGLTPYIDGISSDADKYDMAPQLNYIFQLASYCGIKDLYFPSGTYYIGSTLRFSYDLNYRALRIGEAIFKKLDEDVSVSIEDNLAEGGYYGFVFENTYLGGFYNNSKTNVNVVYENITINYPSLNNGSLYLFRRVHANDDAHVVFKNVKVLVQSVYVCFWAGSNTIIENCEFTGKAAHVIRLDGVENCTVENNYIYGNDCTTGIFFGSNRNRLSRNINIKNNFVSGCTQECISMDGFGNNAGLYPNLAQGNITNAYLDDKGFLVIEVSNLITPKTQQESQAADISSLISKKDNIIFYFGKDTGIDGQYFSILSIDDLGGSSCKVVLKTKGISVDKILINEGAIIGFLTGFINCNIDGNIIENSYGTSDVAVNAVAISLWLNIFGVNVLNNRINGTSRGIMISAGSGLVGTNLYASNNLIANNKINGCKSNAIEVENGYGVINNHNNSVVNNTISYCGGISLKGQRNLLFANNNVKSTNVSATYLDNTYISSNMFDDCEFTENNNGTNYLKQNNFETV